MHNTIILPVVLYVRENWSFTLSEECRLRIFENRVPRLFGPMRDEVTWEWRTLHDKQLYDLYSSPNVIWDIKSRIMRLVGHVACIGDGRGAYTGFAGET
jgi:hypothetical protein